MTSEEIADRVQKFRLLTVAHPLLSMAKDLLVAAINEAPSGSIVMVFGPTGVGKTTLRLKIQQLLSEQSERLMEMDPSRLPFVAVEAAAPDNGTFSHWTNSPTCCHSGSCSMNDPWDVSGS